MDITEDLGCFTAQFEELGLTPLELASRLKTWGDHRTHDAIIRSIQRMLSGDTGVSGEMKVLVNMLTYLQHLEDEQNTGLQWMKMPSGGYIGKAGDFMLNLSPQSKGRWHISIVHQPSGYSHPWPSWQNDLESAKRKALFCLGDARRHIFEWQRDERLNSAL
ncbi:hypothetical protein SNE26_20675 [Mucilaginibacter sp. cycad4]|uniref:hypothetical protein n=1 Tax=Mucilaginibacter sp. cycad4 TaxID=3342096 RepID=UPI002AAA8C8B|nr:hypothetical protein [Mucilaginibacter gossypii]WPU98444.1 hypothetical protein SNE26_20675 [Mucilaginibacter gossypii]